MSNRIIHFLPPHGSLCIQSRGFAKGVVKSGGVAPQTRKAFSCIVVVQLFCADHLGNSNFLSKRSFGIYRGIRFVTGFCDFHPVIFNSAGIVVTFIN